MFVNRYTPNMYCMYVIVCIGLFRKSLAIESRLH